MKGEDFDIQVSFRHRIRFTRGAFSLGNDLLSELLETRGHSKVLVFIENGLREHFPQLEGEIQDYFFDLNDFRLTGVEWLPGAEVAKGTIRYTKRLCRPSSDIISTGTPTLW